jgi:transcriptional regulator of nitric oxide reductase
MLCGVSATAETQRDQTNGPWHLRRFVGTRVQSVCRHKATLPDELSYELPGTSISVSQRESA